MKINRLNVHSWLHCWKYFSMDRRKSNHCAYELKLLQQFCQTKYPVQQHVLMCHLWWNIIWTSICILCRPINLHNLVQKAPSWMAIMDGGLTIYNAAIYCLHCHSYMPLTLSPSEKLSVCEARNAGCSVELLTGVKFCECAKPKLYIRLKLGFVTSSASRTYSNFAFDVLRNCIWIVNFRTKRWFCDCANWTYGWCCECWACRFTQYIFDEHPTIILCFLRSNLIDWNCNQINWFI